MKKYRGLIALWLGAVGLLTSCEQKGIEIYEDKPGVSFEATQTSYSFMDHPGIDQDTLKLTVLLSGLSRDYDRVVKVDVLRDTTTTASEESYELLNGVIRQDEYKGVIPIVLKYTADLDTAIRKLTVTLLETEDFQEIGLGVTTFQILFSARVIKPDNWDPWLYRYFGNYSDSWYRFILEVTNMTSIPCWGTNMETQNPDPEIYWMTPRQATALKNKVKLALIEYNSTHDEPLRHEDGEWDGQEVVMP